MANKKSYVAIGQGNISALHDRKLTEVGCELVGIVDPAKSKDDDSRVCGSLEEATNLNPDFYVVRPSNAFHFKYMKELGDISPGANILLEKPACLPAETSDCRQWERNYGGKIFVNENYGFSDVVVGVRQMMDDKGFSPRNVRIEMSKDRRADTAEGRQIDEKLGVLAYEGSHMLCILDALGQKINPEKITSARFDSMKIKDSFFPRQGSFAAMYEAENGAVVYFLTSMNGNMMHPIDRPNFKDDVDGDGRINTRYRILEMLGEDDTIIRARWEPIPEQKRSLGYVEHVSDGEIVSRFIGDDSMGKSLATAVKYFSSKETESPSPLNRALDIVDNLEALRVAADSS